MKLPVVLLGLLLALPAHLTMPPILMYHRVDVDRPASAVGLALTVPPRQLAQELAYLQRGHIAAISMAQFLSGAARGRPAVILTFDDGYEDQYRYAFPLLRHYGARATFYIVTGTVGTPRHMTWAQLRSMRSAGMDIGAHGVEHDDLSLMSPAEQARQIGDSVFALGRYVGVRVRSYAYPSGRFNRATLQLLQQSGLALAVTTDPRFVIGGGPARFELTRERIARGLALSGFAAEVAAARAETKVP